MLRSAGRARVIKGTTYAPGPGPSPQRGLSRQLNKEGVAALAGYEVGRGGFNNARSAENVGSGYKAAGTTAPAAAHLTIILAPWVGAD